MRRLLDGRRTVAPLSIAIAVACACNRSAEPPPPEPSSAASTKPGRPPLPPPAVSSPSILPTAGHEPDWGLDPADPARDYVGRYVRATKRYGNTPCVTIGPSKFAGDKSIVETRNDASGACGKLDELRDRFFVTTSPDRLSLDESLHGPKLQAWPDGSDPAGPARKPADIQDLHTWKTVLRDTFHQLELAPLRVQLYGRGTYPIISIAGWHGAVQRTMTPGELDVPSKRLCAANDGEPLGIFAGVDRSTLLRIMCPSGARFETL